jgi:methionyl aminopeptidase
MSVALPDFGQYQVILPDEPFVWSVSHIRPRSVPSTIRRPAYAVSDTRIERGEDGDCVIPLGGEDEVRLRSAAALAKKVRKFVGALVRVRLARVFSRCPPRCNSARFSAR